MKTFFLDMINNKIKICIDPLQMDFLEEQHVVW